MVSGGIWKGESRPLALNPARTQGSRILQRQAMESPHRRADRNPRASPQGATESFSSTSKQDSPPSREGGHITANRQRQGVRNRPGNGMVTPGRGRDRDWSGWGGQQGLAEISRKGNSRQQEPQGQRLRDGPHLGMTKDRHKAVELGGNRVTQEGRVRRPGAWKTIVRSLAFIPNAKRNIRVGYSQR